MEIIGASEIWSFLNQNSFTAKVKNSTVRASHGHHVKSFLELAKKVAELQYQNRDHVLLFRGQGKDFRNQKGNTSFKPSLFRPGPQGGTNPNIFTLESAFRDLSNAEMALVVAYKRTQLLGKQRLERHRIVRWSIFQHYEVCPTPLLDVTHSLRIAASFATHDAKEERAYIFVIGVPNLSGAVTASAEAGLQIIRLSSVCPPSAIRPHIQEGYLLGEYPEMSAYEQKSHYQHYEIDFGRRLVAKFYFNPKTFWKRDTFPKVSKEALYPDAQDPLFELCRKIKKTF